MGGWRGDPETPLCWALSRPLGLQDTEVLDSTMYRSKANLGRKRRHRAPVLRPGATSEGDSWIFQDSTGESLQASTILSYNSRIVGWGGVLLEMSHSDTVPHRAPSSPRSSILR